MKKVKLILGNITFSGFTKEELSLFKNKSDESRRALVHEIFGVFLCETKEKAEELGENLCNEFIAYIIPDVFSAEIVFENDCDESRSFRI